MLGPACNTTGNSVAEACQRLGNSNPCPVSGASLIKAKRWVLLVGGTQRWIATRQPWNKGRGIVRSSPAESAMTVITTRIIISSDGTISTATPLPAGEYVASIELREPPARQLPTLPFDVDTLPVHDLGPWPEGLSLRREDMYGDDGW